MEYKRLGLIILLLVFTFFYVRSYLLYQPFYHGITFSLDYGHRAILRVQNNRQEQTCLKWPAKNKHVCHYLQAMWSSKIRQYTVTIYLLFRPSMKFLHKTFPGTSDKICQCAKFHSSGCIIFGLPNLTYVKQQKVALPLGNGSGMQRRGICLYLGQISWENHCEI